MNGVTIKDAYAMTDQPQAFVAVNGNLFFVVLVIGYWPVPVAAGHRH